ncbi:MULTISPECIES: ATP-binding protein [Ramlibacter]|uniref:ATP-binding protein n=1 Tax=Ramlibacter TaxID=174951 RepID=UPI0015EF6E7A|nr:HAMP domain-containing histidine kinase [Ramlibacter sp. CGMCC 1.13660]
MTTPARSFNLLRWFSIVSLAALVPVGALSAGIVSHFVSEKTLQRDAALTAQFIQNCLAVEGRRSGIRDLARRLDPRADADRGGLASAAVLEARGAWFDHIASLPDVLLVNLFARDGRIVWSTNESLVGMPATANPELEEAFATGDDVARRHAGQLARREEQRFSVQPSEFFVETYVPLASGEGDVPFVLEVYKEPRDLLQVIRTGQLLVWLTTAAGVVAIYLGLFSMIRRASTLLAQQQGQLVEAESQVFAGEMATALAHSLRNPLASVRSSAELALMTDDLPVRKNAQDIITQVDFLTQWIRELLLYSRPLGRDTEAVDLCAVLGNVLDSFATAFERAGVRVKWDQPAGCRPLVEGNVSLVTQALHSVVSNAVESMPRGGEMRIDVHQVQEPPGVEITVSDTGVGMSTQQLASAFRPFNTTKAHGLGVGLPMLKRAMERFGGSVSLSSAEKVGTQVRLLFRTEARYV